MSETRSETAVYAREAEHGPDGRPKMRWPKPDALGVVLFLVWVAGIGVATVIPFLIVPPNTLDPAPADVGLAFAVTMAGVALFVGAGLVLARHLKSQAVLVFALVPAVSIVAGGVILTATLLAI